MDGQHEALLFRRPTRLPNSTHRLHELVLLGVSSGREDDNLIRWFSYRQSVFAPDVDTHAVGGGSALVERVSRGSAAVAVAGANRGRRGTISVKYEMKEVAEVHVPTVTEETTEDSNRRVRLDDGFLATSRVGAVVCLACCENKAKFERNQF